MHFVGLTSPAVMKTPYQTLRRCTVTLNLVWPNLHRAFMLGDNCCVPNPRDLTRSCPKLRACKRLTSSATCAVVARVLAQWCWQTASFCLSVKQHRRHVQWCMGWGGDPRNGLHLRPKLWWDIGLCCEYCDIKVWLSYDIPSFSRCDLHLVQA